MIELPPLRERREDIPLLARYFLDEFARRSRREAAEISAEAMEVLMHHGWPGNVRELRNAIEYQSVQAQTDVLGASDLSQFLNGCGTGRRFPERRRGDRWHRMSEAPQRNLVTAVRCAALDRPTLLERLLDANRWHVGHTAAYLGVHRTTLWRHMQRLGLIKGTATHEGAVATTTTLTTMPSTVTVYYPFHPLVNCSLAASLGGDIPRMR